MTRYADLDDALADPVFYAGRTSWSRPAIDLAVASASYEYRLSVALRRSARIFTGAGMFATADLLTAAADAIPVQQDDDQEDE